MQHKASQSTSNVHSRLGLVLEQWLSQYKIIRWLIAIIAVGIYANTWSHQWTIDDAVVIERNRFTQRGLAGLDSLLIKESSHGYLNSLQQAVAGGRWRPLTLMMYAVEAEFIAEFQKDPLGQIKVDEAGYKLRDLSAEGRFPFTAHLINTLLYGLLCGLLYDFFLVLLKPRYSETPFKAYFIGFVAALLFATHPLHIEAVANVKGRDEIMSLLGAVLCLYWLLKAEKHPQGQRRNWYIGAYVAFFLSLLAKEMALTYVAVVPLTLWCFSSFTKREIAQITGILLLIAGFFWGIRQVVLGNPGLMRFESSEMMNDPFLMVNDKVTFEPLLPGADIKKLTKIDSDTYIRMPFDNQLALVTYTTGQYLKLLVYPHTLTCDYYPRQIGLKQWSDFGVILSLLVNLGLLIGALVKIPKKHPLAFAILYFYITYSIVSNLFFPIGTNMAERFMFMPSLGYSLAIALLLSYLADKFKGGFLLSIILTIGISTVLAIKTIERNKDWENNYTLFSKDILVSTNSAKIHVDWTVESIIQNSYQEIKDIKSIGVLPPMVQEAAKLTLNEVKKERLYKLLPTLKRAIDIHPLYVDAWHTYGMIYKDLANLETDTAKAKQLYAINIAAITYAYNTRYTDNTIKKNLSASYVAYASFLGQKMGDTEGAIVVLKKALELDPSNQEGYYLLGTAYSMKQEYDAAISVTEKALSLNPEVLYIKENMAAAYQLKGKALNDKVLLNKAADVWLSVLKSYKAIDDNTTNKIISIVRVLENIILNANLRGEQAQIYKDELLLLKQKYNLK